MSKKLLMDLKKRYEEKKRQQKLEDMDALWHFMGGNCFDPYPPSFYQTHTKEETKEILTISFRRLRDRVERKL